jgi:periplasmic divalent cation tolerance protein
LSIYEWEGRLEEEAECLLLFKTSARRLPELMEALADRHPYELPERLAFEPVESGRDYLSWVLGQLEGP